MGLGDGSARRRVLLEGCLLSERQSGAGKSVLVRAGCAETRGSPGEASPSGRTDGGRAEPVMGPPWDQCSFCRKEGSPLLGKGFGPAAEPVQDLESAAKGGFFLLHKRGETSYHHRRPWKGEEVALRVTWGVAEGSLPVVGGRATPMTLNPGGTLEPWR